jgi:hypothetical protein
MIAPVGAVNFRNNCVHCDKILITGLKLNVVTRTTYMKVEFIGSVIYLILKLNIRLLIQLMALKFVIVQPTVENALNSENVFVVV